MSMVNYAELQTAISNWLHRSDLAGVVPDFIALAESRINSELDLRVMEQEATLATGIGQDYAAAPSRMVEAISAYITIGGIQTGMTRIDAVDMPSGNSNGQPLFWATDGDNIRFDCPLDAAYTITLRYKQGFELANTSTNWLLTRYPRLYLYGAQAEASIYINDPQRAAMFEQLFQQAIREANAAENQATLLRADIGISSAGYNIYRDA